MVLQSVLVVVAQLVCPLVQWAATWGTGHGVDLGVHLGESCYLDIGILDEERAHGMGWQGRHHKRNGN